MGIWQNVSTGNTTIWLMNGLTPKPGGTAVIMAGSTHWAVTQTADLDGDLKADLIWRNFSTGATAAWLMNGLASTATAQVLNAASGWSVKRVQDLDGDGKADLVWEHTDGSVAVWLMDGTAMVSGQGVIGPATGWSVSAVSP